MTERTRLEDLFAAGPRVVLAEDARPVTAADLRAALERLAAERYRPCDHIVRPASPGRVWVRCYPDDPEVVVMKCAALCGAPVFAREVPAP
jgi:hypothetical protein